MAYGLTAQSVRDAQRRVARLATLAYDQAPSATALNADAILDVVSTALEHLDPGEANTLRQGLEELLKGGSERSDESAIDTYEARPGFVPNVGGATSPKLKMDAALKARRNLAAMDSACAAYPGLAKIRIGGR